jgi:hypothetical protein
MADSITYKLEGVDEILDALSALEPKQVLNIIKSVERKDLSENIIKPVRAALPYSEHSKKGIRIISDKWLGDKTALWAGVSSDVFWLRFVEKGTDVRTTKKGSNRGAITARPLVVPTISGQLDKVVEYFTTDFGSAVETIINRKLKKIKK